MQHNKRQTTVNYLVLITKYKQVHYDELRNTCYVTLLVTLEPAKSEGKNLAVNVIVEKSGASSTWPFST